MLFVFSSNVGYISGIVYYILLLLIIQVIYFLHFLVLRKWPICPPVGGEKKKKKHVAQPFHGILFDNINEGSTDINMLVLYSPKICFINCGQNSLYLSTNLFMFLCCLQVLITSH